MMMPWTFRDDISNGSEVIVLTDIRTNRQTDTTEDNTTRGTWVVIKRQTFTLYTEIQLGPSA